MKKLGILGGMGPLATQLLYKMIIENTVASKDQEHIDMIILNHSTIPDRTEAIKSGNVEKILGILTDDAKFLEKGGCTSIAIFQTKKDEDGMYYFEVWTNKITS